MAVQFQNQTNAQSLMNMFYDLSLERNGGERKYGHGKLYFIGVRSIFVLEQWKNGTMCEVEQNTDGA